MKTAIIFGSSGLIGNELFKTILLNNTYSRIKIFVRKIPEVNNPKVEIIETDFRNLEKYEDKINGNDCYFCIGTTKKDTPDNNEYRRVEYDIPLSVAKIAKKNSLTQMKIDQKELDHLKFKHCNLEIGDAILFNLKVAHKTGNNTSGVPRTTMVLRYTDYNGRFNNPWTKSN